MLQHIDLERILIAWVSPPKRKALQVYFRHQEPNRLFTVSSRLKVSSHFDPVCSGKRGFSLHEMRENEERLFAFRIPRLQKSAAGVQCGKQRSKSVVSPSDCRWHRQRPRGLQRSSGLCSRPSPIGLRSFDCGPY